MSYEELLIIKIGIGWIFVMLSGHFCLNILPDIVNPEGRVWRDKNEYDIP